MRYLFFFQGIVCLNYDVIVVGAGPGGSTAAKVCAEKGLRVALIEKHKQAGLKVCAGSLEPRILKEFDVEEDVVECFPRKVCVCGENRWVVRAEEKSATVYREKFDRYLADSAIAAGSKFLNSTQCIQVLRSNHKVVGIVARSSKGLEKIYGDAVVAADGFRSVTAHSAGLHSALDTSDVALCIQYELHCRSKVRDDTYFAFHGNKVSPCGYGWIYPKRNGYTVGLGCLLSRLQGKLTQNLDYLIHKHPIASKILSPQNRMRDVSNLKGACIPVKPSSKICGDGILVVGDAAGQVYPLVGAGIYTAMRAGFLAGTVVTKAISEGDVSENALRKYQEKWNTETGHEIAIQRQTFVRIKNHVNEYTGFQIFLERYRKARWIFNVGLALAKPLLFPGS
jgi:digeranylgeranylglycerophospholipid reductase